MLGNTANDDYRSIWPSFATDLSGTPRIKATRNARIPKNRGKGVQGIGGYYTNPGDDRSVFARKRETLQRKEALEFSNSFLR